MSKEQEREALANELADAINNEFEEVTDALVDDATRTWQEVAIGVNVRAEATKYYTDGGVREHTGYEIPANLQSFAPRLYTFIREYEGVVSIDVRLRPERVNDRENVYEGNLYLIDVTLR